MTFLVHFPRNVFVDIGRRSKRGKIERRFTRSHRMTPQLLDKKEI